MNYDNVNRHLINIQVHPSTKKRLKHKGKKQLQIHIKISHISSHISAYTTVYVPMLYMHLLQATLSRH